MDSSTTPGGEALLVLDTQLKVRAANKGFYSMFRLAPEESVGRRVYELGGRAWDEKLRTMLEAVLSGEPQSDHFELIHDEKAGGRGVLWLSARLVPSAHPAEATILLQIEDLTAGEAVDIRQAGERAEAITKRLLVTSRRVLPQHTGLDRGATAVPLPGSPLKESPEDRASRESAEAESAKVRKLKHGQHTGRETILLVDDEKALRKLGKRILSEAGYRVLEASDGAQALRIAAEEVV